MPAMAVLQPNGLYARFSTIVDDFTHTNLTQDELWTIFQHEGGDDCADGKIERAHDDHMRRFEECLEDIERVHGEKRVEQARKICSVPKKQTTPKLTNLQREIIEGALTRPVFTAAMMLKMIETMKVGGMDLNKAVWDNEAGTFMKI
jgi:hypothetical protein